MSDESSTPVSEAAVTTALSAMKEAELLDFIRDTIVRLETLTDRLEVYVTDTEESGDSGGK